MSTNRSTTKEQYRLKDKKIVIYKKVTIRDKQGFQTTGYVKIHDQDNLWSYFKQLSASLIYASNTTTKKEECLFAINYLAELNTPYPQDYAIAYGGNTYDVVRVDPSEGYKRELSIYAKFRQAGDPSPIITPTASS